MRNTILNLTKRLVADETISGKFILAATALGLFCANTPLFDAYNDFWRLPLHIGLGRFAIAQDLRHWVNEGLMSLFFLVVGLEIKREFVYGQLQNVRMALLPIVAAVGGMVVPVVLYLSVASHPSIVNGWAIPMATDIAFALGALTLLGNRIPVALKLFLLTLAIVDDIGAIVVITLFYGGKFNPLMLLALLCLVGTILILKKYNRLSSVLITFLGVCLWIVVKQVGIHASISGAILGILIPAQNLSESNPISRYEQFVISLSALFIVPVFAFANTGVQFHLTQLPDYAYSLAGGVILGLVLGKFIGVFGASWLFVKLGLTDLPEGVRWPHIAGVSLLAGIGFTVSIFVTDIAFDATSPYLNIAKLSIFIASALSAALGIWVLRSCPAK